MLPYEISLTFPVYPGHMDRALALDVPHYLRHRVFRRYRDHHVHMIRHQMPFLDPAFLLLRQLLEHLPEVSPQLAVQRFPATLGNENYVVLALTLRVT